MLPSVRFGLESGESSFSAENSGGAPLERSEFSVLFGGADLL